MCVCVRAYVRACDETDVVLPSCSLALCQFFLSRVTSWLPNDPLWCAAGSPPLSVARGRLLLSACSPRHDPGQVFRGQGHRPREFVSRVENGSPCPSVLLSLHSLALHLQSPNREIRTTVL